MSKDIRSYFFKPNGNPKDKTEQDSPQSKKRTRRVIESDDESDDVIFLKKKAKEQPSTSQIKSEKKKPEVVVEVESFFGRKPVQQKKQLVTGKKSEEKKEILTLKKHKTDEKKKENKKNNLSELSFENDDELEASLLETDDEQLLEKKEMENLLEKTKVEESKEKKTPGKEGNEKIKTYAKEDDEKEKKHKKEGDEKKKKLKKEVEEKNTPRKGTNLEEMQTPKLDKRKPENTSVNSEQKKRNAEAYQKYLNRSGPKNPGSKAIPKGTPTCLQGLTFVITGVLDSMEREEANELIQKYGGRVTGSVSKKTDYIVLGEEPGASKIQKAENFGTKKINEDQLLDLIREKSGETESEKNSGKEKDILIEEPPDKTSKYFKKESSRKRSKKVEEANDEPSTSKKFKEGERKDKTQVEPNLAFEPSSTAKEETVSSEKTGGDLLWVDKYKPKSTKNIIGQTGEKSNVKKLIKWLQNWHKNHSQKGGKKPSRPAFWAHSDDGGYFKAALLSGPPGVGKTTTVQLVCEELGFDMIEFNASDTRSKKLLQEEISELLSTKSIRGFFQGSGGSFRKHVLVMDEVDGMAGNEDRGGIQELIQLIKNTKIPIIGICNDRNHQKMRSLVNYCFDLRFQRPRVEQIKGAVKSICFKEKLDISGEALEELIVASNHDVRQILHSLSLLASGQKTLSLDDAKKKAQQAKKPLNLSPWDVARKVFSASEQEKMNFTEKTDLFFQDYSLGPLFIQDTYLRVKPYKAQNDNKKKLELISKTADCLALGDIIERAVRSQNAWGLLPVQAIFSSVLPGHYMSGHVQGQIQFPVWLGKNSKSNKFERLLQDLHSSLRITITGTKESVNLDYLNHLKNAIVTPLVEEGSQGIQNSLRFMLAYHLMKEDLDNILELSGWHGVKDAFSEVDSKVKAAFTRALNKEGKMVVAAKKTAKPKENPDNLDLEVDDEDVEETENDNIDLDPMIKIGKSKVKKGKEEKGKMKEEKKGATGKEIKKKK